MYLFSFEFTPYIAIIGDIVESKRIMERKAVQQRLAMVLFEINEKYAGDIASRFMITLGDEFQGLLGSGAHALEIIERIERQMYPTRMRFGIGVGEITTDIDSRQPLGADGPAYYNARKMINELKAAEKQKMAPKLNIKIEIEKYAGISELINTIFSLNAVLKEKWTDRQREVINAYLMDTGTQMEVARKLGIHQSNVQKALSNSNFYTYQRAVDTVTKILSEIKEKRDA